MSTTRSQTASAATLINITTFTGSKYLHLSTGILCEVK